MEHMVENEGTGIGFDDDVLDTKAIEKEITNGEKALEWLEKHSVDSMEHWATAIHGWRALRDLIFAETGTMEVNADRYRKAMTEKLRLRKYAGYERTKKWQRSAMYKLADSIDDVMVWYRALDENLKQRWQTPEAVLKHVPQKYLSAQIGNNRPKRMPPKTKKPKGVSPELVGLQSLLIMVITEFVMPINPKRAAELLTQANALVTRAHALPSDPLDDLAPEMENLETADTDD